MDEPIEQQSLIQKQITFANNAEMVQAAIEVIKSSFTAGELVGDSEYATVVNAVKFDTQQDVMVNFWKRIEYIRGGGLLNAQQS